MCLLWSTNSVFMSLKTALYLVTAVKKPQILQCNISPTLLWLSHCSAKPRLIHLHDEMRFHEKPYNRWDILPDEETRTVVRVFTSKTAWPLMRLLASVKGGFAVCRVEWQTRGACTCPQRWLKAVGQSRVILMGQLRTRVPAMRHWFRLEFAGQSSCAEGIRQTCLCLRRLVATQLTISSQERFSPHCSIHKHTFSCINYKLKLIWQVITSGIKRRADVQDGCGRCSSETSADLMVLMVS
jgi:hypothetical protein